MNISDAVKASMDEPDSSFWIIRRKGWSKDRWWRWGDNVILEYEDLTAEDWEIYPYYEFAKFISKQRSK